MQMTSPYNRRCQHFFYFQPTIGCLAVVLSFVNITLIFLEICRTGVKMILQEKTVLEKPRLNRVMFMTENRIC